MKNTLLAGGGENLEITNPILAGLNKKSGADFFSTLIPNLISLSLIIGSVIFFFNLVVGAIQWMSSGGDKQGVEGARSKVTNAVVGLVIMFVAFAILRLIQYFFGIKILTLDIGSLVIQ